MPTLAQEALAEGINELTEVHGSLWKFGKFSFAGVGTALRPDDPRMQGSPDRLLEIISVTSKLPASRPARSDELSRDGKFYRIVRVDHSAETGLTTILVTVP